MICDFCGKEVVSQSEMFSVSSIYLDGIKRYGHLDCCETEFQK